MVFAIGTMTDRQHIRDGVKLLASAVAIITGITTTVNVASAKWVTGNQTFQTKVAVVASRLLGPGLTNQIFTQAGLGSVTGLPPQGISPLGWLNPTTISGIAILIVNHFAKRIIPAKFGYHWVSPLIDAVGVGLTAGGLIGGLLDPAKGVSAGAGLTSASRGSGRATTAGYLMVGMN
jgi:hypothetical protein